MVTKSCRPYWQPKTVFVKDANGNLQRVETPIPDVEILSATESPGMEDHDFLPPMESTPDQVWQLSEKASKSLVRIIKEAHEERDRLLKKADRLIRRCYRLQERTRREKLKGASMDRLWDIQLRRITIAGELGNIYRRLQPWE